MQIEEGYRMNAEADNFLSVADLDCVSSENSVLYTAISRKVVGKSERDNPERHCGWFLVHCSSEKF